MGILTPVRTTKQWLWELFSPGSTYVYSGSGSSSSVQSSSVTCQQSEYVSDKLPVDILHHIQSLLPLKDAARTACLSRGFLHAWRCYSNLTLNAATLGWLKIVFHSGIKELSLMMPSLKKKGYIFPCWVLSDEAAASSVQFLDLHACAFRTTTALGCSRSLRKLHLSFVDITDDGLGHFLSKASALEEMDIFNCSKIICLKLPCTLQQLKLLRVTLCESLQAVDINAPKLSTFHFIGTLVEFSTADASPLKDVTLASFAPSRTLSFARARLPAIARNVISLTLRSVGENVNTPMLPDKLLHLKSLEIKLGRSEESPMYDIFSVVSFLDASPALESFILHAERDAIICDCVAGDDLYLRGASAYKHDRLRRVKITGFHSAKSLIKLVIHILDSAPSLEALTLDTTGGYGQKASNASECAASRGSGKCSFLTERDIKDANIAVESVGRYIAGRVPSAVEFQVLEPCRRCHTGNQSVDEDWWDFLKQHTG